MDRRERGEVAWHVSKVWFLNMGGGVMKWGDDCLCERLIKGKTEYIIDARASKEEKSHTP